MSNAVKTGNVKSVGSKDQKPGMFYFGKHNYFWMIGGIVVLILGLILMAGGRSADPNVYNEDELFSFRRITLAPVLMMIGFAMEVVAIMKKPKPAA